MGGKSSQITGYEYFMTMHFGLCRGPINSIIVVKVNTLICWDSNIFDGAEVQLNSPNLFGGPTSEGGITGTLWTYFGTATQVFSSWAKGLMQGIVPDFRGLATVLYDGQVASNNPYLKPWAFRARRTTAGWFGGCWYPQTATISIAAAELFFYNQPTAGQTLSLNGSVVTYVAEGDVPGAAQIAIQVNAIQDAQALVRFITANPQYGLLATSQSGAGAAGVTLTLANTSPNAPKYTLSTSGTQQNPTIYNATLQGGAILAMNPAHILYEVCTNPSWGRGLPFAMMDDASFRKAADQMFAEGFGLCLKWSQRDTLSSFIQTVLEHISAVLYISRRTGLMTLKLLRADYDPTTIPFFSPTSGLIAIDNDDSSAGDTSFNEIIVSYHDPIQDIDLEVRAQNLASWKANQSTISKSQTYGGIPTVSLANRVALRDLNQQAVGLKRFVVKLDQSARYIAPGDVIAVNDPTRNIDFLVLRVALGKYGTPTDQTITLTCLQDVFSLPATTYLANNGTASGWIPPNNIPAVATQRLFMEANYRDLSHYLSASNLAAFPSGSGAIAMLAANPGLVSAAYQIATSEGAGVTPNPEGACPWACAATLVTEVSYADTEVTLTALSSTFALPAAAPFAMILDGEWCCVTAFDISTGVFTITRGCVDTVPVPHAANTNVFFPDFIEGTDYNEYLATETVNAQVLAMTSNNVLSQDVAPTDSLVIAARQFKPYPPGNVTVNGSPFSDMPFSPGGADCVFAWSSRNRVLQADALIDQTQGNVSPEEGTTYNISITNNGTVVRSVTGITALTWTYTAAMQDEDSIAGVSFVQLQSERDGEVSWTSYEIQINVPPIGFGYGFGTDWGN